MTVSIQETRRIAAPLEHVYGVVEKIEDYPLFLPWCLGAAVTKPLSEAGILEADLLIGYKTFRDTYSSTVTFEPHHRITVDAAQGPLNHLQAIWRFESLNLEETKVCIELTMALKSPLLMLALRAVLPQSVIKILNAFETQALTEKAKTANHS